MAKISILMNGYNAQAYLKEAIDSVYAQTFQNWEIIFIDNCSVDNTKNIIDSYDDKIKYYKTNVTIPLGAARNYGLKYCKGEYLAFLDTDDIWLDYKLEKQMKMMELDKHFKMCYGGVIYIDENSKKLGSFLPMSISGDVFASQLIKYEINMQSVIIKNDIKLAFDEEKQFSPDFELFMRIVSKYNVGVIREYLVKYRKLKNSLTSKKIDRWGIEMQQTLDYIFSNNQLLKNKYKKEYKIAYAKVSYNKAQYLISINKKYEATKELSKYKFVHYKYFILYISSIFPIGIWNLIHRFK